MSFGEGVKGLMSVTVAGSKGIWVIVWVAGSPDSDMPSTSIVPDSEVPVAPGSVGLEPHPTIRAAIQTDATAWLRPELRGLMLQGHGQTVAWLRCLVKAQHRRRYGSLLTSVKTRRGVTHATIHVD